MSEEMVLEWDTSTGAPPKKGERLRNMFGEKYVVISRKGNKVVLLRTT